MRLALAAALLFAFLARAEEPLPKNVVLADLGLHVVGLGFQRTLSDHLALQVSFNLYVPWTQNQNFLGLAGPADVGDLAGLVARARLFVYPQGRAPTGFWVSPFVQGGLGQETRSGGTTQGAVWALGAAAGWAWLFFRRLHLQLGLGEQYHAGPRFGRLYPHVDLNLGVAF